MVVNLQWWSCDFDHAHIEDRISQCTAYCPCCSAQKWHALWLSGANENVNSDQGYGLI